MHTILHLVRKEFRQVFRDRTMLGLIFFTPIVQMIFMGFAVSNDIRRLPLAIVDLDRSAQSRALVQRLGSTDYFTIADPAATAARAAQLLDRGDVTMAVVVPRGFARDLQRGGSSRVQLLVDGSNSSTASLALGYAGRITGAYAFEILTARAALARSDSAAIAPAQPAHLDARVWYNPNLVTRDFMVPGILVILLTMTTTLLTSMSLVRERELGTLEQLLVTPIKPHELLLGKLLPFAVLGMVQFTLAFVAARAVFHIPMAGSVPFLWASTAVFLLVTLGMGLLVSTMSATQQQAMFVSWFFNIFFLMMCGFFTPIDNMPPVMQRVSLLDPLRYYLTIVREVTIKGAGLAELRGELATLAGCGVTILLAAILRFRRRLA